MKGIDVSEPLLMVQTDGRRLVLCPARFITPMASQDALRQAAQQARKTAMLHGVKDTAQNGLLEAI